MADQWRVEADPQWLAAHSSDNFARLRRGLRRIGWFADAVSQAELGPLGGAPRNPRLKVSERKAYDFVRYAHENLSHTAIQQLDLDRCRRCGEELVERHAMSCVREDGARVLVGTARFCRRCQTGSWMFHSRMPSTRAARRVARKVVL